MNPEQMAAHFGWAPEDDDAAKLAKVCSKMAGPPDEAPPAAMGDLTISHEDEDELKENLEAMAKTFGINPEGMPRKVLMAAIRNAAKPAPAAKCFNPPGKLPKAKSPAAAAKWIAAFVCAHFL